MKHAQINRILPKEDRDDTGIDRTIIDINIRDIINSKTQTELFDEDRCHHALLVMQTCFADGGIDLTLHSAMRLCNTTPFQMRVLLTHPSWAEPIALGVLHPGAGARLAATADAHFSHTGHVPLWAASRLWHAEHTTSAAGAFRVQVLEASADSSGPPSIGGGRWG